jgi:hypothetical protein
MKKVCFLTILLVYAALAALLVNSSHAQDDAYSYYGEPGGGGYDSNNQAYGNAKPSAFDGISYGFFDIGWRYFTFNDDKSFLENSNGLEINGSVDFLWLLFFESSFTYTNAKADSSLSEIFDFDRDSNYTRFEIGPGVHFPISPNFNLVLSAGYQYASQDLDFDREARELIRNYVDGSGLYVKPGARMKFGNHFEFGAFAEWSRYSSADKGTWGASTDLIFWPAKWIGITGHAEFREDVNSFGVGLRFSWD